MSVEIHVDRSKGRVTIKLAGPITMELIKSVVEGFMRHPEFHPGDDVLWDFRETTISDVSADALRDVVSFIERRLERRGADYKVALAASTDLEFGLARMYEAFADRMPFRVMVFRDLDKAITWLDED
jgi:hypothetical protein